MTSPTLPSLADDSSALSELIQETAALTRRLFLQLLRRPSTLIAGILQPLIWLILFGALFANALTIRGCRFLPLLKAVPALMTSTFKRLAGP